MTEKSNIEKWIEGGFNQELLIKLKKEFPNDAILQKAEYIVKSTDLLKPKYKVSKAELWNRIEEKIVDKDNVISINRHGTKSTPKWWLMAAASVVLIFGSVILWNIYSVPQGLIAVSTDVTEKVELALSDGSEIFMNASTKIEYNKKEWSDARTINLKGEAFFKVVKGNTFTVTTELGKVTVLGTSFNVKARNNLFVVSCKTGRVRVDVEDGESIELTSGTTARFEKGKNVIQTSVSDTHIDGWTAGNFYFTDIPLVEVFDELENQFDVKITIENEEIFEKRYTGFFNINNVEQAIEGVCLPLELQFKFSESRKEIRISD